MELTQKEYRKLIMDVGDEVMRRLNKKLDLNVEKEDWVTTKEAAAILHCSPKHVRVNKDNYVHTKSGDNKQGQLRFLRSALLEHYINR